MPRNDSSGAGGKRSTRPASKKTKLYVYSLYEKGTRVKGSGTLRTLILEDDEGRIPVLTNDVEMGAAKVVHLLKMLWRQENSVKCLSEHYDVEQLIQYGADYQKDDRMVDNPKRAELRKRLDQLPREIIFKEAELGRALELNNEQVRKTVRGVKLAHSGLRREIDQLYLRVARNEKRLAQTPTKVPIDTLKNQPLRAIQRTDRQNLVNAIKIATYNAERLLAGRFFRHYRDPRDWLTIFRSLLHLSGSIHYRGDHIAVRLTAPDRSHGCKALEATRQEVKALPGRAFGTGLKLVLSLES